jgi:hypothetical protein
LCGTKRRWNATSRIHDLYDKNTWHSLYKMIYTVKNSLNAAMIKAWDVEMRIEAGGNLIIPVEMQASPSGHDMRKTYTGVTLSPSGVLKGKGMKGGRQEVALVGEKEQHAFGP